LHKIALHGTVASGMMWNEDQAEWHQDYVKLPVVNGRKVILVPKASVRWTFSFSAARYYNHFVLNFLQADHIERQSSLVEYPKNGGRRVTKKSLMREYPFSKDFLAEFSLLYPGVSERYKELVGSSTEVKNSELDNEFDERAFCEALERVLRDIPCGRDAADNYHRFCIGMIEFIFFPYLIYSEREADIHENRKRIDIRYTNNAVEGFFLRMRSSSGTNAHTVVVECKNYQKKMANPELDQISSRFSPSRGRLGLLLGRSFDDRERFLDRCRDTFRDDRGVIILLVDRDLVSLLELIKDGRRRDVDLELEHRFREIMR
jgi:hypothetical protein